MKTAIAIAAAFIAVAAWLLFSDDDLDLSQVDPYSDPGEGTLTPQGTVPSEQERETA